MGCSLRADFRRMGRAAHQGSFGHQGDRACAAAPFSIRADTAQKRTETSLIERFLYPKFGPGQMWEEVARRVTGRGGEIHLRHRVVAIERRGTEITAVTVRDEASGNARRIACDSLISTMPVKDLCRHARAGGCAASCAWRNSCRTGTS